MLSFDHNKIIILMKCKTSWVSEKNFHMFMCNNHELKMPLLKKYLIKLGIYFHLSDSSDCIYIFICMYVAIPINEKRP